MSLYGDDQQGPDRHKILGLELQHLLTVHIEFRGYLGCSAVFFIYEGVFF